MRINEKSPYPSKHFRRNHILNPIIGHNVPEDFVCIVDMLVAIYKRNQLKRFSEFHKIYTYLLNKHINASKTQDEAYILCEYANRRLRKVNTDFRFVEPFIEAKKIKVVDVENGFIVKRPRGRPGIFEKRGTVIIRPADHDPDEDRYISGPIGSKPAGIPNEKELQKILEQGGEVNTTPGAVTGAGMSTLDKHIDNVHQNKKKNKGYTISVAPITESLDISGIITLDLDKL